MGKTAEELAEELRPVSDLEHYRDQLEEVNKAIETLLLELNCTLITMPGIDVITAANMLSEIGEITRFPSADKLAEFAGIAPVNFSSAGKGKDMCPKQGNRRLQAIFYFMAIQMIQISTNGTPRNKVFREYYLKRVAEGKNKQQALIGVSRRPVNIVYGMRKTIRNIGSQSNNGCHSRAVYAKIESEETQRLVYHLFQKNREKGMKVKIMQMRYSNRLIRLFMTQRMGSSITLKEMTCYELKKMVILLVYIWEQKVEENLMLYLMEGLYGHSVEF